MTLSSGTEKVQYNGDGTTTVFPVPFAFWSTDDLRVILQAADGSETAWARGTHYTVAGGAGGSGTLTVLTSPTNYRPQSGQILTIKSDLAVTQPLSLPLGGDFPSNAMEQALDKIVRLIQQTDEQIGRAIVVPEGDPAGIVLTTPSVAARANKALIFDEEGNLTVSVDDYADQVAAAQAAADAATAGIVAENTLKRFSFTMAGGESEVTGTDDAGATLGYVAGLENVYVNGVLLVRGLDYLATDGALVHGMTALVAGDVVIVEAFGVFALADLTDVDIDSGTIDGTAIGATTPSTGEFTTLGASVGLLSANGSVSAPAYSFTADTDTGLWREGGNRLSVTTGGVKAMSIDATGAVELGGQSPTTSSLRVPSVASCVTYLEISGGATGAPVNLLARSSTDADVTINLGAKGNGNYIFGNLTAPASTARALVIANGVAPSANPSGGGVLYVESGALKYRGASGTVTTLAVA